jgi:predicted metal-dependent phosphoesterase TrpH
MIDLHVHTTASDGTLSPTEMVRHAHARGLSAVAITDHDTVEGVAEALAAGAEAGIEVVPGIEISAEHHLGALHVLGYYMCHEDERFLERISVLQQARNNRNPRIIERLRELGISITLEQVQHEAETGQVGRPHFAKVMVQQGYVRTVREAFDRYLKKGAPAYVDKYRFEPEEAIGCIRDAGGVAVLAHPAVIGRHGSAVLQELVASLKACGLQGIEVYYPEHSPRQQQVYQGFARQYSLIETGGSDFHGNQVNGTAIGTGRGSLHVPDQLLQQLKDCRTAMI